MRILVPPTRTIRADGSYVAISDGVKPAVDHAASELSNANFLSPADGRDSRRCRPESARRATALELVGSGVRTLLGFHRGLLLAHQLRLGPRASSAPKNHAALVSRLRISGDLPRPPRADWRRTIRGWFLRAPEGVGSQRRTRLSVHRSARSVRSAHR